MIAQKCQYRVCKCFVAAAEARFKRGEQRGVIGGESVYQLYEDSIESGRLDL